ncbi:hypothetical protein [Streptomyces sp. NPDC005244]|uniref:hypothetical protein n=1 Tax=Streptomyces sp. NPDC005244 TaxID=3364708 RepID=UPI0036BD7475
MPWRTPSSWTTRNAPTSTTWPQLSAPALPAQPGLTLTAYSAEPGTPAHDGLRLLSAWADTEDAHPTVPAAD